MPWFCCLAFVQCSAFSSLAGEMSDAGELLLVLFEHMKSVAPAVAGTAVDAVFGLRVAEAVECQNCGRETQQSSYTQVCRGVHLFRTLPDCKLCT
jgi:uncharacterized UBP type Zn finger protein